MEFTIEQWREGFALASKIYYIKGHLDFPEDYVFVSKSYSFPIGEWSKYTRENVGKLTERDISDLVSHGFIWNSKYLGNHEKFDKYYPMMLKCLSREYGLQLSKIEDKGCKEFIDSLNSLRDMNDNAFLTVREVQMLNEINFPWKKSNVYKSDTVNLDNYLKKDNYLNDKLREMYNDIRDNITRENIGKENRQIKAFEESNELLRKKVSSLELWIAVYKKENDIYNTKRKILALECENRALRRELKRCKNAGNEKDTIFKINERSNIESSMSKEELEKETRLDWIYEALRDYKNMKPVKDEHCVEYINLLTDRKTVLTHREKVLLLALSDGRKYLSNRILSLDPIKRDAALSFEEAKSQLDVTFRTLKKLTDKPEFAPGDLTLGGDSLEEALKTFLLGAETLTMKEFRDVGHGYFTKIAGLRNNPPEFVRALTNGKLKSIHFSKEKTK